MVLFLSWGPPSQQQQKACIDASGGAFNYPADYHGASRGGDGGPPVDAALAAAGFHVNRSRVLLGSGPDTFLRAKAALSSWKQFRLGWAFVEAETPVEKGTKFCVCVKEILPWLAMPLQIAYVSDTPAAGDAKALFSFGSGTLRGHLLAGEERFSVERDGDDRVFYEIFSFSRPAHLLSTIGLPYVRLRQKHFAQESARALMEHLAREQPVKPSNQAT